MWLVHSDASPKFNVALLAFFLFGSFCAGQSLSEESSNSYSYDWAKAGKPNDFQRVKKNAEQGEVQAQRALGLYYSQGVAVQKNVLEAEIWLLRAANQGDVKSQILLALLYENEQQVRDMKAALKWYIAAADQGDAYAQFAVGFLYDRNPPRNPRQAVIWYAKAAAQGFGSAQSALDLMQKRGDDVPIELLGWYRGAEMGDPERQWQLAQRYLSGDGVVKSFEDARYWLQLSADQGYILAQVELGRGYLEGDFLPKDLTLAYMWLNLAAARGFKPAAKLRDYLSDMMTKEQISAAQVLSRGWKAKSRGCTTVCVNAVLQRKRESDGHQARSAG